MDHEDPEGMNPGDGAMRRMYTVDGHLPSDQHGVTRRLDADRISPGREKRTRTTSPILQRTGRPVSESEYEGIQARR